MSNWKLHERYYKAEKGKDSAQESHVEDVWQRDARDASSAVALGDISKGKGKGKGKGKPAAERHKAAIQRMNFIFAKLNKAVASQESRLPSLKRSLTPGVFQKLRAGLAAVRTNREDYMDQLEELKECPGEDGIDDVVEEAHKPLPVGPGDSWVRPSKLHSHSQSPSRKMMLRRKMQAQQEGRSKTIPNTPLKKFVLWVGVLNDLGFNPLNLRVLSILHSSHLPGDGSAMEAD